LLRQVKFRDEPPRDVVGHRRGRRPTGPTPARTIAFHVSEADVSTWPSVDRFPRHRKLRYSHCQPSGAGLRRYDYGAISRFVAMFDIV
jgi:hypothetical protein